MIPNKNMANAIRMLAVDAVQKAKSGHPGLPMGMADVATVLFSKYLKISPSEPNWASKDRFILSAGHGSMLIYSLLYLLGYKDITIDELKNFRQLGSKTAGHPEFGHTVGIETTTGPLGQGIANAVGFALAERLMNNKFPDIIENFTYVICGDGCLMEGISQEAISLAGHLNLNKLIVLWDNNGITIEGKTDISTSDNQIERFKASQWNTIEIDGHNYAQIDEAIAQATKSNKPTLIACKTIIGFGSPNKQGTHGVHGSPLGDDEILATRKNLNWNYAPFEIPSEVLESWRQVGKNNDNLANQWKDKASKSPNFSKFQDLLNRKIHINQEGLKQLVDDFVKNNTSLATREIGLKVLEILVPNNPSIIGGSADLTPSVRTLTSSMHYITSKDYSGNYIAYGIREHAMTAMMNGLYLYGGFKPYAGGFLVFADYMRPAIRLACLMKLPIIYVLTHDSIGVGEDGPTHQPVETIASLRTFPNMNVFRPCDVVETVESWVLAMESAETPSVLALSRQNLPTINSNYNPSNNRTKKGGYIIKDSESKPNICIFASGSEVEIAIKAQDILNKQGKQVRVISVPCLDLLKKQPKDYIKSLAPAGIRRCVIDAGVRQQWDYLLLEDDIFIGMEDFGASAPFNKLYNHFNITVEAVVEKLK